MTELIKTLYDYASENLLPAYLIGTEYDSYCTAEERATADIQQLLPPDRQKHLKDLLTQTNFRNSAELEAAFQAGLSLGLELSRL